MALPLPSSAVPCTPSTKERQERNVFTLAELLGGLSHALDLTDGQPVGHSKRACWIGTHIGIRLGLTGQALSDLYFAVLLKDLGCSSNAARICELFRTDDIAFKRGFRARNGNIVSSLRFTYENIGAGAGFVKRIGTILNCAVNRREIERELIETRCHRGADIAARMRFSKAVQDGIRGLDEFWDGSGSPGRHTGDEIPLASRIALVAQIAEVFHARDGREAARAEIAARRGTWFDPGVVEAFLEIAQEPGFWEAVESQDLDDRLFSLEPALASAAVTEDYADDVAAAFADVIDAKSPYTAGHSRRVTLFTDMVATEMGLEADRRRWLRRAALLHDIGKLAVSNRILDKPGKPTEEEWAVIRSHAAHGADILHRVAIFRDLADIARGHHERLDGKGYPFGLKGDEIAPEVRMLTVADVFDALTADRPYRPAMRVNEAFDILGEGIGTAFDGACVAALRRALDGYDARGGAAAPKLKWT